MITNTTNQVPFNFEQKPSIKTVQKIQLNRNYVWPLGVIRILIIICLCGGLISSFLIVFDRDEFFDEADDLSYGATRLGLIICYSVFLGFSLFIFSSSITNLVNLPGVQSVFWLISFIVLDSISLLAFFFIGLIASVEESHLGGHGDSLGIRNGVFAACAVFSFVLAFLQMISVAISIPYVRKLRQINNSA